MTDEHHKDPIAAIGQPAHAEPTPPEITDDDLADEHNDVTLADDMAGGPEGRPEDDSPEGLAGHPDSSINPRPNIHSGEEAVMPQRARRAKRERPNIKGRSTMTKAHLERAAGRW